MSNLFFTYRPYLRGERDPPALGELEHVPRRHRQVEDRRPLVPVPVPRPLVPLPLLRGVDVSQTGGDLPTGVQAAVELVRALVGVDEAETGRS